MEKLDRDIKTSSNLPPGYTQSDAEKQQKFLRSRYELIANLRDAIGVLTMAEFRGYSILQKRRFHGGANDGGLQEFYWLPQSNFQRDGAHGDWFYNADSSFGATPERLSEKNRIGSEELPREDFVI